MLLPYPNTMVPGRRPLKAAQFKIDILQTSLKLIGKNSFDQLYVESICEKVGISKVTFFKYFPQKDDILLYYHRVWLFDRAMELAKNPKEGLQGIYYLKDELAASYYKHPGIILGLISHLTSFRRPPGPFPLKPLERQLLYPGKEVDKIDILSMNQLIENFALEAIFKKEITRCTDTKEIANMLLSVIYGSIVSAHLHRIGTFKVFVTRNLEMAIKGLG